MKIAIVEDELVVANELKKQLDHYSLSRGIGIQYVWYDNAEKFIDNYDCSFDLVFMDIRLGNMNGMEAAEKMRTLDERVLLVFVTNMRQFALKGYKVNALDFMVKPVEEPEVFSTLDKAVRVLNLTSSNSSILLKTNNGQHRIAVNDIMYVEIRQHKLTVHTINDEIESWGTLSSIEEYLPKNRFVRCNVCYLVNLSYIKSIVDDSVTVGADELKIARTRKREFLEKYSEFLGETGGVI